MSLYEIHARRLYPYQSAFVIFSLPFIYGRSTSGIATEPSAFWFNSKIGINNLGLAMTVLFSVWQKTFFFVFVSLFCRFFFGIFILIFVITNYVSLGAITAAFFFPFITIYIFKALSLSLIYFSIVISLLVILTHRKNIYRLLKKEESKMPLNLHIKNRSWTLASFNCINI